MASEIVNQIAEELGLHVRTVQRALAGQVRDTRPTVLARARRIRELGEKLGYRPNAAARATATGRFQAVSLVVKVDQVFLPTSLIEGAARELAAHDLNLVLTELPAQRLVSQGFVPKILRELSVDGLLIGHVPPARDQVWRLLQEHTIPTVWINDKLQADCVFPDDLRAGQEATRQLIELGHRQITYVTIDPPRTEEKHFSHRDRQAGYGKAMRQAKLPADVLAIESPYNSLLGGADDPRIDAFRTLLRRADRPTAVVAYETTAAGPLLAAALSLGLRLPQDLSVVTFHASAVTEFALPLRCWRIPMGEVAVQAVQMLMDKINGQVEAKPPRAVPYSRWQGEIAPPLRP